MYTELRGEVLGRQRSGAEASECHERAGRDVTVMGRKGVGGCRGQGLAAELSMYFYELRTSAWPRIYKSEIRDRSGIDDFCTIGVAVFGIFGALGSLVESPLLF